mgnify:CR=1 FL=1
MSKFIILTDSCIDLPNDLANKMDLKVIPLSFFINEKEYKNYLDERELSFTSFYETLENNTVSTAQLTPYDYEQYMETYLKEGYDILNIVFSSALSGTYNSSLIATEELQKKYQDRKIYNVDSKSASMGQGLLVTYAYELKQSGRTIDEIYNWLELNKLKFIHLFTVGNLNHLKRGGRLTSTQALLGNILKIKPVLYVNNKGQLIQKYNKRGRKKAILSMIDEMEETIINSKEQIIYISHGNCIDDALWLKEKILERIKVKEVIINFIGPVIGTHSGPNTLALFYFGKSRE